MQTITKVNLIGLLQRPSLRVTERRHAQLLNAIATHGAYIPRKERDHSSVMMVEDSMHIKAIAMTVRELMSKANPCSKLYRSRAEPVDQMPRPNRASSSSSAVRVPIVVTKAGNAAGTKGGRKINT